MSRAISRFSRMLSKQAQWTRCVSARKDLEISEQTQTTKIGRQAEIHPDKGGLEGRREDEEREDP